MRRFLLLGMGVQSTWLYFASAFGYIPKIDHAVFIDPGREKTATTEYLSWLLQWSVGRNIAPIHVVQRKNLYTDLLNQNNSTGGRFSSIPAFTKSQNGKVGMLRRQCTNEYKIEQADKAIRELVGLLPRQRFAEQVELWQGISSDEIDRMVAPDAKWKLHVYPFCGYAVPRGGQASKLGFDYRKRRSDIVTEYQRHGLPVPPKSSCVFCPYQSDLSWFLMKMNHPNDFADAVAVDTAIRNSTAKGINQPVFLHRSCKPLGEIGFSKQASDLWGGECSGTCHV